MGQNKRRPVGKQKCDITGFCRGHFQDYGGLGQKSKVQSHGETAIFNYNKYEMTAFEVRQREEKRIEEIYSLEK